MTENSDFERDIEQQEWIESLDEVIQRAGPERAGKLLESVIDHGQRKGLHLSSRAVTPYINTIPLSEQPEYPGDLETEDFLNNIIRWNAMAMVVRANREEKGIGGHISTYASSSTLYEVGFNHFFRGRNGTDTGDMVYFQGHASPGMYSRAYLEGRISEEQVDNFRHEHHPNPGLSSYPHPWLMPDFWQFPTVSMGLGPLSAIYHARFIRYLENRGLKKPSDQKVWAFLGDGETDEPEAMGAIGLAAREGLDNLIFVINCNLQRLDGPVRGNGSIISELEGTFRGAGWNAIKVIWGSDWDELFAQDTDGLLVKRMGEVVDGQYQKYIVEPGSYFREDFFGKDPKLLKMVEHLSDEELKALNLGGHDPKKIYAAYKSAAGHTGSPTVILTRTVKGYGLGKGGEGMNMTHQQKKLNEEELKWFRTRFNIPLDDEQVDSLPFYKPEDDHPAMNYLQEQRKKLNGYVPERGRLEEKILPPPDTVFGEFIKGTDRREVSTTMAFVKMLTNLLADDQWGKRIVPIVSDEARTFGMESLFRQCGIYSPEGQLYEPVDRKNLLYYRELKEGQILEEGITEAGCMGSFIAAGTSYANHSIPMLPFFMFYSMFGFQRIGDFAWEAGDSRAKGFLMGGTSGRTTLAGEGLQHQDGNSHLTAFTIPNLVSYDPAYAYELAVIIQDGIRRMYGEGEDIFYYITIMNENYAQPPMPEGAAEQILKGLYLFSSLEAETPKGCVSLLGSGAILNEAVKAAALLSETFNISSNIYSATSYRELYREAVESERQNRLDPDRKSVPWITECLGHSSAPIIAASDYVKAVPLSIAKWIPGEFSVLGTDGFGRSDGRAHLRKFFEVDAAYIALEAVSSLVRNGTLDKGEIDRAVKEFDIDPDKADPVIS